MNIDPILYSIPASPLVWALLSASLCAIIVSALTIWSRLVTVIRKAKADNSAPLPDHATSYPPVSVIVYSQADADNLATLLPQILDQDYPAPFEVIVANDQSSDATESVVARLQLQYPNLYLTFAPEHSRNLSRRKLAITLGIKAARFDTLIHTCGNCTIPSDKWLRAMMRHVTPDKPVVISYANPTGHSGAPDTDARPRRRAYDELWHAIRFLSPAIHRHPFMGTSYNLVYSRSQFFDAKGFADSLNLRYGDDDIFLNIIANGSNTSVELSDNAIIQAGEFAPRTMHNTLRQRRDFTAQRLPRTPYLAMALSSWAAWIAPAAAIAAAILGLPSLIPALAALILLMAATITHMLLWRRASRALHLRPLLWTVPFLTLTRPLRTLIHRLRRRSYRRSHTTNTL